MTSRSGPGSIAVVGGGTMGAGIAYVCLVSGASVLLVERDRAAATAARGRVDRYAATALERGLRGPTADAADRLSFTTDLSRVATADLIIEAVPEDLAVKREVLRTVERFAGAEAMIGSCTSSLSISALGSVLAAAGRFIGLHFFSPVPSSSLVEIVVGNATSPTTVDEVERWVTRLDKVPVSVQDSPGFATSRLGVLLGLEAVRMLEEGVASADSIDQAMVLGYRHPVGPLRLSDLVGLDVRLAVADYLTSELGDRFRAPDLLRDKVSAGELGRKAGRGFYEW